MTTKSPTSTCGAYWGLCLPRRSCAVWLASRPSTTSVASMTCQARLTSPGLGVYVRTALVSSVVVGKAGGSPHRARETVQRARAPAGPRASRPRYQPGDLRLPAVGQGLRDLVQAAGGHVVDHAADLARDQVGALLDQPDRLAHVVVGVPEGAHRPRRTASGRLLDEVGEGVVVGGLQTALGVVHQQDLAGAQHVLREGQ